MILPVLTIPLASSIIFLTLLSIIDISTFFWKNPAIPSVLTTTFIITQLIATGTTGVYYGIIAGLIGLAYLELGSTFGMADIKVLSAMGITTGLNGLVPFMSYIVITAGLGIIAIGLFKYHTSKKNTKYKEMPYIPVFLISYIAWLLVIT